MAESTVLGGSRVSRVSGEPRTRRVAVADGVSLAVRIWEPAAGCGSGVDAPLVLVHGIAGTADGWDGVADRLAAEGRAVFSLDFRGHGESDRPEGGYDLATFASDLETAVAALGLKQPILVGHSLGAWVILEAIAGGRLSVGGVGLLEGGLVDARDQFGSLDEALAKLALPPVAGMPIARLEGYLRQSNPKWSEERLAATLAAFDVAADGTASWRLTGPRLQSLVRSMWDARVADQWSSLNAPSLVVAAEAGDAAWTEAKRAAEGELRRAVPAVRVEWLAADHEVHMDRPEQVATLLIETFTGR